MQRSFSFSRGAILAAAAFLFFFPQSAKSQAQIPPAPRITAAMDESRLTTLHGNTHPMARPQFDRGAAPPSLPLQRMLMVLKRGSQQESALQLLLEQQQDASSPNFHGWLSPQQFGRQFGPSDQDIQTITSWLQSHGFQVTGVSAGRTVIEFSGTAGEVQEAFHTSIHRYTVNGTDYWANASDPQIPTALSPVVAGVNTLYNFPRRAMHELFHPPYSAAAGAFRAVTPQYTFPNPCSITAQPYCNFAVAPADFAKIYNVPNLLLSPTPASQYNGDGVTIVVVGESDINTNDIAQFRSMFGLPAPHVNVIVNGPDPGTVPDAETEADLDIEWSGAIAPNAVIDFVVAQSTEVSLGVDLAAQYAVDNNLAPILSESFGICEYFMGTADNTFYNQLWQQAAAQGITVTVASGDGGSAVCDQNAGTQGPAQFGVSVSGFSSTPYNVAVGGTDFDDVSDPLTYWSLTNTTTLASTLKYIPETTWNDTCTNQEVFSYFGTTTALETCNNSQANTDGLVIIEGGTGGKSACTTSDFNITSGTGSLSSCAGGYPKPAWQTALTPQDSGRDLPDVSMFASDGFNGSFYVICEADIPPADSLGVCGTNSQLVGLGGTSASTPSFAGIMALVNQATGSRQGNANYALYKMAAQSGNTCTSAAGPASSCIFYDIPTGSTNAMPCASGSPGCTSNGFVVGVLSENGAPAYNTAAGYDLATGLGSVNAANLVTKWKNSALTASSTTLSLNSGAAVNTTHGQSVNVSIGVTGSGGTPTGTVSLIANTGPNDSEGVQGFALSNGSVASTANDLPGGSYTVFARYGGDGTFGSSSSSPAIPVTVAPEASKIGIAYELFNPTTEVITNPNAATAVFGTPSLLRVNVTSQGGDACASNAPGNAGCPTGSVTLTDSYNGAPAAPLNGGTFALNAQGYTEDQAIDLPGGTHIFTATYAGDNSYAAATPATQSLTITTAPTTTTATSNYVSAIFGQPVALIGSIFAQNIVSGIAPTGTVTFYAGSTALGIATVSGLVNPTTFQVYAYGTTTSTLLPHGQDSITAQYSGDANYAASTTTAAVPITVLYATTTTLSSSNLNIPYGASVTFTAQVATNQSGGPAITGTVGFSEDSVALGAPVPLTNGQAQITTTSLPSGIHTVTAGYQGDSNYAVSVGSVTETVGPAPSFTISANPTTVNISSPGQSGTATLTFTAQNGFSSNGPVTITPVCLGLPSGASCSSGATVTIATNGTATATVTFKTTAPSWVLPNWSSRPDIFGKWTPLGIAALASLCWLWTVARGTARKQRRWAAAFVLVVCAIAVTAAGCGGGGSSGGGGGNGGGGGGNGGNPGTPTGTTIPAIDVTINGVTAYVNVTLNVQ
jgi:Pro-kumamolisin, activation domain/Bacterial Ig-like domain (group 3)